MFEGIKIGFAVSASFCTIPLIFEKIENLINLGADVTVITSDSVLKIDTRFGKALDIKEKLETLTKKSLITTIVDAEPIGPKDMFDILVVCPCSGTTIAKFANAINDTSVLMSIKSQLRNSKPVVLSITTNDGLSGNFRNIGTLLNRQNIYFVPFYQDDPIKKSYSLIANLDRLNDTIKLALEGKQIQPILDIPNKK